MNDRCVFEMQFCKLICDVIDTPTSTDMADELATNEYVYIYCSKRLGASVVAQLCHSLGWHSMHSSACDVLVEILSRYMLTVARTSGLPYSELDMPDPQLVIILTEGSVPLM